MAWTDTGGLLANTGDLIGETQYNGIVNNLEYLLDPEHDSLIRNNAGNYSLTNVIAFQAVDATNLAITLNTNGGPVMVGFTGVITTPGATNTVLFDFSVDSARYGQSHVFGLARASSHSANNPITVSFTALVTGLSAASHAFVLQWRTGGNYTVTLASNTTDNPVLFWAIEG